MDDLCEFFWKVPSVGIALMIIMSLASPGSADTTENKFMIYQFGIVPQFNASRIVAIWRPILDELEKQTGLHFRLAGSDSIPVFEKEFSTGRFDFVYMNPYHFVRAERSQGYLPMVRDVEHMLYGILVVRKDSAIQSVMDLDGKILAFPAPKRLVPH